MIPPRAQSYPLHLMTIVVALMLLIGIFAVAGINTSLIVKAIGEDSSEKVGIFTEEVGLEINSSTFIALDFDTAPSSLEISGSSKGEVEIYLVDGKTEYEIFKGSGNFENVGKETSYLEEISTELKLKIITNDTIIINSLTYEIIAQNKPAILIRDIPDVSVIGSKILDMNEYFFDIENEEIKYSVKDKDGVLIKIDGSLITIVGEEIGEYTLRIYANDGFEITKSNLFLIEVVEVENFFNPTTTEESSTTTVPETTTTTTLEETTITTTTVPETITTTIPEINETTTTTTTVLEEVNLTTTTSTSTTINETTSTTSTTTTTLENITIIEPKTLLIKNFTDISFIGNYTIVMDEFFLGENLSYTIDSEVIDLEQNENIVTLSSTTYGIDYISITANNLTSNLFAVEILPPSEQEIISEQVMKNIKVGEPVKWKKVVRGYEFNLPIDAKEIKVKKNKKEVKFTKLNDNVKVKDKFDTYEIEYEMPGPTAEEKLISETAKEIVISSEEHYENVTASIILPEEAPRHLINVKWIEENRNIEISNFIDNNNNGLIEEIEWIVPHLSNQTFIINITVLNPIEYLRDGDIWDVKFETVGVGNLTIWSENSVWEEMLTDLSTTDEMEFLDINCSVDLKDQLVIIDSENNRYNYSDLTSSNSIKPDKFLIENYNCSDVGHFVNYMNIAGYAILELEFRNSKFSIKDIAVDPTSECNYKTKLTFNNSAATESLENFTIMVKLNSSRIDYSKTALTDIRFFDDDETTQLNHHWEDWDESGTSIGWVKIPVIDNTNTDFIYISYNCSNTITQNITGTYDDNFEIVHHLNETSGTHYDATSNNRDGTVGRGTIQNSQGFVSGADEFDGADDNLDMASPSPVPNSYTAEAWVYADTLSGSGDHSTYGFTIMATSSRYALWLMGRDNDEIRFHAFSSSATAPNVLTTTSPIGTGEWHFITATAVRNGPAAVYVDGEFVKSGTSGNEAWAGVFTIGDLRDNRLITWDGKIDEVRISNINRSASWISASYLTMNDSFIIYGLEEATAFINVSLDRPIIVYTNATESSVDLTYNATIISAVNLSNCSLWQDMNGTWLSNQTEARTGKTNTTSFTMNSSGIFSWNIECCDIDDNCEFADTNRSISIGTDAIAPAITFVPETTLSGNYSQNWIFANVSIIDNNLDNVTIYLYNNSLLIHNSRGGSTTPLNYNFTSLPDGTYYLNVTANDTYTNVGVSETRTIILDNIGPKADFYGNPVDNYNSSSSTIAFQMNCSDDRTGIDTISLWSDWSGWSEKASNSSYTEGSLWETTIAGISDGTYNWGVYCNDSSENEDRTINRTITIDTINPNINYHSSSLYEGNYSQDSIYVNVIASDAHLNIVTIYLYNNSGLVNSVTSSSSFSNTFTSLPEGTYYVNASAEDYSGNRIVTTTRTIILDETNPSVNLYEPSGTISWPFPLLNVSVSDSNSGIDSLWYNIDGGNNIEICSGLSCLGTNSSFPVWLHLAEGNYIVNVYANDTAGNLNNSESSSITIDFNNNYYDSFSDESSISDYDGVVFNSGNISFERLREVFNDTFADNNYGDGNPLTWTFVDNVGSCNFEVVSGVLTESTNCNDGNRDTVALGSYVYANGYNWTDVNITSRIRASDDDSFGIMFRYIDDNNYYRVRFDGQSNYRRLERFVAGAVTVLDFDNIAGGGLTQNVWADLNIVAINDSIEVFLDGASVLNAIDSSHDHGSVAAYVWGMGESSAYGGDFDWINVKSYFNNGNYSIHSVNTTETITKITNVTWSESKTDANNNISIKISVDNGVTWYDITNGTGISENFTEGNNSLVYRAFFESDGSEIPTLDDINISWSHIPVAGNSAPTIANIAVRSYTPNEGTTKTVYVAFNVTDLDGTSDIDPTQATANITKGGTTYYSTSCVNHSSWTGGTNIGINCSITLNYYDLPGHWNISVFANDTQNEIATDENSTELTYNELYSFTISDTTISFTSITLGDNNHSSTPEAFVLNNTGNGAFANINLTAYQLVRDSGSETIAIGNFTINATASNLGTTITSDMLISDAGTLALQEEQNIYFKFNAPTGLPAGTYETNSTTEWVVEAYN